MRSSARVTKTGMQEMPTVMDVDDIHTCWSMILLPHMWRRNKTQHRRLGSRRRMQREQNLTRLGEKGQQGEQAIDSVQQGLELE
jgi:hypothetical protein